MVGLGFLGGFGWKSLLLQQAVSSFDETKSVSEMMNGSHHAALSTGKYTAYTMRRLFSFESI